MSLVFVATQLPTTVVLSWSIAGAGGRPDMSEDTPVPPALIEAQVSRNVIELWYAVLD